MSPSPAMALAATRRPQPAPAGGGVVAFVSGIAGDGVFDGTSINVLVPPGIAIGNLLLVHVVLNSAQAAPTMPSGFTSFGALGIGDKWAFWKIADSADVALSAASGSWSVGVADGFITCHSVVAYENVNTTTPFAVTPAVATGNTTTPTSTSLTGSGVYVVGFGMENNSGAATYPGALTLRSQGTTPYASQKCAWLDTTISGASGALSGTVEFGFEWSSVSLLLNAA